MLRHGDIWKALDRLAHEQGLTPSGLARRAGLDPTTFNKSKRITRDGKLRWPSTESLAKVLEATGVPFRHLVALVDGEAAVPRVRLPVIDLEELAASHFNRRGLPAGAGWDEAELPEFSTGDCYALRVTGNRLAPVFRDGDLLIVSPSARIAPGDRVLVRLKGGEILIQQLASRTSRRVGLKSLAAPERAILKRPDEIVALCRIMWASQ
jgi:phage repressor protein C with HTH and peptisase S24 domain